MEKRVDYEGYDTLAISVNSLANPDNREITEEGLIELIIQMKNIFKIKEDDAILDVIKKVCKEMKENENVSTMSLINGGHFSFLIGIGEECFKIGRKREFYEIPFVKELMYPHFRKEFGNICLEGLDLGDPNWTEGLSEEQIEEELYKVWKAVMKQGGYWVDVKEENLLRLLKDNIVHHKPFKRRTPNMKAENANENGELCLAPSLEAVGFMKNDSSSSPSMKQVAGISNGKEEVEILKAGSLAICDSDLLLTEEQYKWWLANKMRGFTTDPRGKAAYDRMQRFMERYQKEEKQEKKADDWML